MTEFYLLDMRCKPGPLSDDDGQCDGCPPPCRFTKHGAELMVWWGPNNSGYRARRSCPSLCRALTGSAASAAVIDGPGPVVINHSLMWDLLEPLAWTPA